MQQTRGMKHFVGNHVAMLALAAGVVIGGALSLTRLAATGHLADIGDGESKIAAPRAASNPMPTDRADTITGLREAVPAVAADDRLAGVDRADRLTQLRLDRVALPSSAPVLASLDRTDLIAGLQRGAVAPTISTAALRFEWFQNTHRYWTPEVQARLTTGGYGVDHIPPRLRP
jgi:hypothetical protein